MISQKQRIYQKWTKLTKFKLIDTKIDKIAIQDWLNILLIDENTSTKINEPEKLRKTLDEKAVHGKLGVDHEAVQGPKGVLLVVQVHEEEGGDLGHPLAVAQLRVVHGIRGQNVEKRTLTLIVAFTEHDVITVGAIDIQINLKYKQ